MFHYAPPMTPISALYCDAAFEQLHPRGPDGRFIRKEDEESKPSPNAQKMADRVKKMLSAFGIQVRPVKITVASADYVSAMTGTPNSAAAASKGEIFLSQAVADSLDMAEVAMSSWRKGGVWTPSPDQAAAVAAVVHEMLHQSGAWSDANDGVTALESSTQHSTEEGIVQAVAFDVMTTWLKKFGARPPAGKAMAYKDETVAIRRLSSQATGLPWTYPQAARWRMALYKASYDKRQAMIASAKARLSRGRR